MEGIDLLRWRRKLYSNENKSTKFEKQMTKIDTKHDLAVDAWSIMANVSSGHASKA
jgi:hypothetical protein